MTHQSGPSPASTETAFGLLGAVADLSGAGETISEASNDFEETSP